IPWALSSLAISCTRFFDIPVGLLTLSECHFQSFQVDLRCLAPERPPEGPPLQRGLETARAAEIGPTTSPALLWIQLRLSAWPDDQPSELRFRRLLPAPDA